jgi:hypothetical protein
MSSIPYNYGKYVDDSAKLKDQGTIGAGEQINSPSSAGSRGLAKTTQFTNDRTQMQMGNSTIAESMVEIRNILNRIDGVNVPTNEAPDNSDIDIRKLLVDISAIKDRIAELAIDDGTKTSALTTLGQVEDDIAQEIKGSFPEEESYQPFPEGDEFNIEEDEDFEEVLGPLGFPEDETELFDAEYQGRKVPLNKPMRGDVKKFKVYVKDPKTGNVKKVNFGHGGTSAKRKTMRIRKSNPKARKSFRARHNCANPGPKTKARYWSCRKW